MWPNYYLIEAIRLGNERQAEANRAALAHAGGRGQGASRVRRAAARVALGVSGQLLGLAGRLDACVLDRAEGRPASRPLG
ncbi:MAG: hypothetical protein ACRDGQ_08620 [Candidatus Limnocylindrales bacterium]